MYLHILAYDLITSYSTLLTFSAHSRVPCRKTSTVLHNPRVLAPWLAAALFQTHMIILPDCPFEFPPTAERLSEAHTDGQLRAPGRNAHDVTGTRTHFLPYVLLFAFPGLDSPYAPLTPLCAHAVNPV